MGLKYAGQPHAARRTSLSQETGQLKRRQSSMVANLSAVGWQHFKANSGVPSATTCAGLWISAFI